MLCMAELSTAMPKAGGTYYFLDRALGPLFGTIGGLGSWVAVVFKSAFALVGMGAYLSLLLVSVLVVILAGFVIFGLAHTGVADGLNPNAETQPFFTSGTVGFVATIGLVFVSYAGLTKVASVAEEVQSPDRNIPLGMILSLLTATAIYTLGLFVIIAILTIETLYGSLKTVADAGAVRRDWPVRDPGLFDRGDDLFDDCGAAPVQC